MARLRSLARVRADLCKTVQVCLKNAQVFTEGHVLSLSHTKEVEQAAIKGIIVLLLGDGRVERGDDIVAPSIHQMHTRGTDVIGTYHELDSGLRMGNDPLGHRVHRVAVGMGTERRARPILADDVNEMMRTCTHGPDLHRRLSKV